MVDVDDCVAGARFIAAQGRVDGKRCVISGGSAGCYTTLVALTFRDVFQGGASHYGVSDVAALARDTHKFESRYLDWLIGPYYLLPQGKGVGSVQNLSQCAGRLAMSSRCESDTMQE